jgi:hypothetical protein
LIKEETIYEVPAVWAHCMVPDWRRCEKLEAVHGHVTQTMIMRELCVSYERAHKILQRWESMKEARIIQAKLGREE